MLIHHEAIAKRSSAIAARCRREISEASAPLAHARVIEVFKEKEVEKEVEERPLPQPPAKPRRAWKDRDQARVDGLDPWWAARVGEERYWSAKREFMAHKPRTHFWSIKDATKLGQFLERCPSATLEDIRAMLAAPPPQYRSRRVDIRQLQGF